MHDADLARAPSLFRCEASVLSYATGPNAGQVITNPSALNGNGQVLAGALRNINLESLNNATNDLRHAQLAADDQRRLDGFGDSDGHPR